MWLVNKKGGKIERKSSPDLLALLSEIIFRQHARPERYRSWTEHQKYTIDDDTVFADSEEKSRSFFRSVES